MTAVLEEIDRRIVELLARDGRMSYTDVGRATGLSTSAAHQRVRRLEERGVITGYAATVDPVAVALPLTAFVSIKPIDPSAPDDAPERLAGIAAIEACHSVAGEESYILKVRVSTPGDLETAARRDPREGERVHPHHGRAVHAVRGAAARRSPRRDPQAVATACRRHHSWPSAGRVSIGS